MNHRFPVAPREQARPQALRARAAALWLLAAGTGGCQGPAARAESATPQASGGAAGGSVSPAGGAGAATVPEPSPESGGGAPSDAGGLPLAPLGPPYTTLSQTGLYAAPGSDTQELGVGVQTYTPRFELWSDAADKRRFVFLPPGATIDTTDVDSWEFPIGTKFWKEFSRDGRALETRLLEKVSEDDFLGWELIAFLWREDGSDADAVPDGATDVLGTTHDVPARQSCRDCHFGRPDRVLGFGAIQLSHAGAGLDLQTLAGQGLLDPPLGLASAEPPGSPVAVAALGYLHANCGHCHIPGGEAWEMTGMELHLSVASLARVEDTRAYLTTLNMPVQREFLGAPVRLVAGAPLASSVYVRMQSRGDDAQMPDIGTEIVDDAGSASVAAWIIELQEIP